MRISSRYPQYSSAAERSADDGSSTFGTYAWDIATGRVSWSQKMYELHGIGPDEFGGHVDDYARFVHSDDIAAVEGGIRHLLEGGEPKPLEYRVVWPDGEERHLLGTSDVVRGPEGEPLRVVGTVRDITRLRRSGGGPDGWAEEALQRSEERFRALIENSFDVIVVFDRDGTILYATPSCRRMLGWEPEEIIGRSGFELVHPEDLERAQYVFEVTQDEPGSSVLDIHRIRHEDGSWRTVEISGANLLHHPALGGMVANLRDVTEREEAIAALRRSESQYRDLVDHAVFGIYRSTLDGRLLSVNKALADLLGFESVDELLEQNMRSFYADPDERDERVQRHARTNEPFSIETRWLRRDGEAIMVRLSGRPVTATKETPAGFEVMVEDVSHRHALEEALLQSQKMEAVGRLAGGVAHDFNNLLTVILGEVELGSEKELPEDVRDSFDQIRQSAERAAALTGQLLSFSRRELVRFEVIDCNALVAQAGDMLRRLIEENVRLEIDLGSDVGAVHGDRTQLEQLLVNLVVNARDSMPDGGTLRITTRRVTGDERSVRASGGQAPVGDYVLLELGDTGFGMSDEVLAHVFEPFFTTKHEKGTGLGLATCYSVVKQHAGEILIASEQGVGTRVSVFLPRASGVEEEREAEKPDVIATGSETILLVEDEPAVRLVSARMLEEAGYEVLTAGDGDEAEKVVNDRDGQIDLLVTDVVLPGVGGRKLAESLQRERPGLRVLYVSGYTDDAILRRGVSEREVSLVRKPFTAQELTQRVREVLDVG